jgi:hypothetical protein
MRIQGRLAAYVLPQKRQGDHKALIAGMVPTLQRPGEKTMLVKHASQMAARLSIPAGATLAATYLLAVALTHI